MSTLEQMDQDAAAKRAAHAATMAQMMATATHENAWAITQFLSMSEKGQHYARRILESLVKLDKGD